MALIKCPECGKEVSSTAPACPIAAAQTAAVRQAPAAPVQQQALSPKKNKNGPVVVVVISAI